jgi:hypothetical protein
VVLIFQIKVLKAHILVAIVLVLYLKKLRNFDFLFMVVRLILARIAGF